jgi:hypothetical protein
MTGKSGEASGSKKVPRESDNPIVEEYKDDLLNRPGYGAHPGASDEVWRYRLEGIISVMQEKLLNLEKRIQEIEAKK